MATAFNAISDKMQAMICKTATFERELAPPQEDFPRPVWTRVTTDGVLLTNSAEYAAWDQSPCELFVCELCWHPSCAMSNLARAARLGDWLVFYPPELSDLPDFADGWRDASHFLPQTLFFSPAIWRGMRTECIALPKASTFPAITRKGLVNLWLRGMPVESPTTPNRDDIPKLKEQLLVSDPLDESAAVAQIDTLLHWSDKDPNDPVDGTIVELAQFDLTVNTLHLDGKTSREWRCFTASKPLGLILMDELVFIFKASF